MEGSQAIQACDGRAPLLAFTQAMHSANNNMSCTVLSLLHSHWSRLIDVWLSLVKRFTHSYAIKKLLRAPKAPNYGVHARKGSIIG